MEQVIIVFTGVVAIWLTQQSNDEWKKYACLFGMAGQPFWLYAAYTNDQWGIFIVSIFYAYSWGLGINNNWLNK